MISDTQRKPPALKSLVLNASAWTFGGYGAGMVLRLANSIILSRLLFPEAFGLMTLVGVFIQAVGMFSDIGTGPAIIQNKKGDDPEFLNTAWTIQILRGFGLWFCVLIGTYPFAIAYGHPEMLWLIPVAGLREVVSGFNSTKLSTANRRMQLGTLTIIGLLSQVLGLTVTIVWAWHFRTVWALVGGSLAAALTMMLLSHFYLEGSANRFAWDRQDAKVLMRFGKWVFASTALTFCVQMSDRLIFGQMVPTALLGMYGIAFGLATIPASIVQQMAQAIAFPAYSRVQRELGSMQTVFYRLRTPIIVAGGAGMCFLILTGPLLTQFLYDPRYYQAGWMLQILSVGVWFQILESNLGAGLLALGHSRLLAFASAMKLVGMLILIPLGYHFFGFPGAVAGYSGSEIFRYVFSVSAAKRNGIAAYSGDLLLTIWCMVTIGSGFALLSLDCCQGLSSLVIILMMTTLIVIFWAIPAVRATRIMRLRS